MKTDFTYIKPESLHQALQTIAGLQHDFRLLAGGTDVMVNKQQGNDFASCMVDLTGLAELQQVEYERGILKIGALTPLEKIAMHPLVQQHMPVLAEAIYSVASPVIRKTATLGGNLLCENRCTFYNQSEWWRQAIGYCLKCDGDYCIATGGKKKCFSKFSSDLAIVLIAHDTVLSMSAHSEISTRPLEQIYTGDGVTPRILNNHSLLLSVEIPVHKNFRAVYKKLRPRKAMDFSSLTSVVSKNDENQLCIVLGAVDPMPVVAKGPLETKTEMALRALKRSRLVDNDVYSREYRKKMIACYIEKSFEELKIGSQHE